MFAQRNRFSFKKGAPRKVFSTPLFILRYDIKEENRLECAVVVGKKVDKRAVVRNKVKRQLVKQIKEMVELVSPFKLVIIAKKQILDASTEERYEELLKAFQKTNILQ